MKEVNPKDFANAIMQDLTEITDSMIVNVKKATDEVAMEAKDVIDSHITFNDYGRKGRTPGKYRRSFKLKQYLKQVQVRVLHGMLLVENMH